MTKRFIGRLKSRKHNNIPGDERRRLTHAATAQDGTRYKAGTVFVPLCAGASPAGDYSDVTILEPRYFEARETEGVV